jgi:hypothetical protein
VSKSGRKSSRISDKTWGRLTTASLALTVLVLIFYTVLFVSPSFSLLGSKEEPTSVALLFTPTPRPTVAITDTPVPSWTPKPTLTTQPTNTPRPRSPTRTPRPTVVFTLPPTPTGTPTATRHPYPFKLSDDGVQFMRYFFGSECNWLGIAGEVRDQEGEPVTGISVVLNGGGLQNIVTTSGNRPDYAPSGWEHFLDNKVKEGDFTIQLWHQGQPVSEIVDIRTRADCRANLVYLVFEIAWEGYTP